MLMFWSCNSHSVPVYLWMETLMDIFGTFCGNILNLSQNFSVVFQFLLIQKHFFALWNDTKSPWHWLFKFVNSQLFFNMFDHNFVTQSPITAKITINTTPIFLGPPRRITQFIRSRHILRKIKCEFYEMTVSPTR